MESSNYIIHLAIKSKNPDTTGTLFWKTMDLKTICPGNAR